MSNSVHHLLRLTTWTNFWNQATKEFLPWKFMFTQLWAADNWHVFKADANILYSVDIPTLCQCLDISSF